MELNGARGDDFNMEESDSEGETIEDNSVVEGVLVFQEQKAYDDWYTEEAAPLGQLFGFEMLEDEWNKLLLWDLNLNFGIHGKSVKRLQRGEELANARGILLTHES